MIKRNLIICFDEEISNPKKNGIISISDSVTGRTICEINKLENDLWNDDVDTIINSHNCTYGKELNPEGYSECIESLRMLLNNIKPINITVYQIGKETISLIRKALNKTELK